MKRIIWITLLQTTLLTLLLVGVAYAQEGQPGSPTDNEVNAIAKQLYCPVCENIPLDVCPTQACTEWREDIRDKLALGWDEAEIKQYFVNRYGDRVLATPPPRGLNWLAYVIPPTAILLGAFVLYRAFRSWKRPLPQIPLDETPDQTRDDYIARLEEELRRR